MPSKFCRSVTVLQPPSTAPHIDRTEMLNQVQRLINAGMCVSALSLARTAGLQFNAATLRSWAKDRRKDRQHLHRKTYAFLVLSARPQPEPTPVVPVPITRPPTHPSLPPAAYRRYRFVRVPSKVAC